MRHARGAVIASASAAAAPRTVDAGADLCEFVLCFAKLEELRVATLSLNHLEDGWIHTHTAALL